MRGARNLLCCSPQLSRQLCYDILKKEPEVIDLLLQCAVIPRPEWYPDTDINSIACEVLVLLFHFPNFVNPGMHTKVEGLERQDIITKLEKEWRAMIECLKMFTRRPGWLENIVAIWSSVENEKLETIQLYAHILLLPSKAEIRAL